MEYGKYLMGTISSSPPVTVIEYFETSSGIQMFLNCRSHLLKVNSFWACECGNVGILSSCMLPARFLSLLMFTFVDNVFFVVYFMKPSVPQTVERRMVIWLVINKFQRIWKDAVDAIIAITSRHWPGEIEENHQEPFLGWPMFPAGF
jgi:hypothetical protein